MPLKRYETMEIAMLLSIINMKLRDECPSLEALLARYDLSRTVLVNRLAQAGYRYRPESNQFIAE